MLINKEAKRSRGGIQQISDVTSLLFKSHHNSNIIFLPVCHICILVDEQLINLVGLKIKKITDSSMGEQFLHLEENML